MSILGANFHVEAVEVEYVGEDSEQVSKIGFDESWLDEVLNIVQGAAQTVRIDDREYVLSITPFQR